jgi:glycerol-3-phosphate acyltransferase PlsY
MNFFLAVIIGYLLGSINSSILVAKLHSGIDIRKHGSGNAGATNTLRTLGKGAAFKVLLGDFMKGILAVTIGILLSSDIVDIQVGYSVIALSYNIVPMAAGFACVLGHNYPLYFSFKGGKGILTSAAVILMIDWRAFFVVLLLSILVITITKYVSLGSIVGALVFPTYILLFYNRTDYYFLFACLLSVLAIIRHIPNIKRLIKGTETKISIKSKGDVNHEK